MTGAKIPSLKMWVADPPPKEVRQALERMRRADDVVQVAAMPDIHLAGDVCIGTVVATSQLLYPQAVGGDIGCGIVAIQFDLDADVIRNRNTAAAVLRRLEADVPVLKHRFRVDLPPHLADRRLSSPHLEQFKRRDAVVQLGTVGRGNHFIELQADEDNRLWLMVHTGSRGAGPLIRDHHLKAAKRSKSGLLFLDVDQPAGQAYLHDLQWAIDFADANRLAILESVIVILHDLVHGNELRETYISCNHNHLRREDIVGQNAWVHRKGAISARNGEKGLIPGSMGSSSFHVSGRGCRQSLYSSSHGAGRSMSRVEARRTISRGQLAQQMEGVWFDARQSFALVDEAPSAYKDITKVMRAQRDLTKIVRRLTPILNYKGA